VLSIEAFRVHLGEEVRRTRRHDRASALAILEVDAIAQIHRDHGYDTGDKMLRALVAALRGAIRTEDVLGRVGDARFALLLCDADGDAAQLCMERLRGDLEQLEAGPLRGVPASVGIAPFGRSDEPIDLIERAGRALADAQAAGGGRVVTAAATDPSGADVVAAIHRRDAVEALAVALLERDRYTGEHSEVFAELVRCAGSQFDPDVTAALVAHLYYERAGRPPTLR